MPAGSSSSRDRALEIGTDPGNFPKDQPYDYPAGHPKSADIGSGTYKDNHPPQAVPGGQQPSGSIFK